MQMFWWKCKSTAIAKTSEKIFRLVEVWESSGQWMDIVLLLSTTVSLPVIIIVIIAITMAIFNWGSLTCWSLKAQWTWSAPHPREPPWLPRFPRSESPCPRSSSPGQKILSSPLSSSSSSSWIIIIMDHYESITSSSRGNMLFLLLCAGKHPLGLNVSLAFGEGITYFVFDDGHDLDEWWWWWLRWGNMCICIGAGYSLMPYLLFNWYFTVAWNSLRPVDHKGVDVV